MEIFIIKIIVLIFLGISSLLAAALPWFIKSKLKRTETVFSMLNCLSGGVVLGAAFSHMFPESQAKLKSAFGENDDYPYTSLFSIICLLFLWGLELELLGGAHAHSEFINQEGKEDALIPKDQHLNHSESIQISSDTNTSTLPKDYNSITPGIPVSLPIIDNIADIQSYTQSYHMDSVSSQSTAFEAYVFVIALSMHSLFEGLGLGAESEGGLTSIILAVVSHKSLEAFALGLSIFNAKFSRKRTCAIILGYSCATPIGIAIGMSVPSESNIANLITGILTAVAAGSFMYISLVEILPIEFHKQKSRKRISWCLGCTCIGLAFMAFIAKYA